MNEALFATARESGAGIPTEEALADASVSRNDEGNIDIDSTAVDGVQVGAVTR
jgi:hypothetical protein